MKRTLFVGLMAAAVITAGCNNQKDAETPPALDTVDQRVSYLFGLNLGEQLKREDFSLDIDAFALALADIAAGTKPRLDEEEMQQVMKQFQDRQVAKHNESLQIVADANKKEGEDFLEANKAKDGVVVTASGLQYKVLSEGTGPQPTAEDMVTVHYRGTLIDGTEFDSSLSRGEPVSFPLNGVIPGWTEGLQLMKEGAKYEFYIPAGLAYGPGGSGPIGPNSTLIFEVDLIKVGKPTDE